MLGHLSRQTADADPAMILSWLRDTVLRPEHSSSTRVRIRLRGNILHVLFESTTADLTREFVLMRLVRSLLEPAVKEQFEAQFPQIYQIYVYSRKVSEHKPTWSAPIYLNRLERHLEWLVRGAKDTDAKSADARNSNARNTNKADRKAKNTDVSASSEQLSNIKLARQGDSDAIAHYLSEALSALNVGVQVSARVVPGKTKKTRAVVETHTETAAETGNEGESGGGDALDGAIDALDGAIDALKGGGAEDLKGSAKDTALEGTDLTNQSLAGHATVKQEGTELANSPQDLPQQRLDPSDVEQPESEQLSSRPSDSKQDLVSRLWVFCEASYSPDPLLIAEPIAQRLRQLHLLQFQDAVITIQVTGEAASDWRLRVDLTPPEQMLQEWGRWGDVPALSQLVNQISKSYGLKLVTEVRKNTLHLISYPINPVDGLTGAPLLQSGDDLCRKQIDVNGLVASVARLLDAIAPQGLHRAMLYGPSKDDISPEWLRGLDLPAMTRPALMPSTASLAASGDLRALAYYLTRSLNPDITEQLATGGIRVQLLTKDNLLHVMADGPICPPKHVIVPIISQTLKQLHFPDIEGLRLYGRRAGQKQPIWSHGHDYVTRPRLVPEAQPEFAASDAYAGELITTVSDDVLSEELAADKSGSRVNPFGLLMRLVRRTLVKSQVFTPLQNDAGTLAVNLPDSFQSQGLKMAVFWGIAGLLLTVQFDFVVGQALGQAAAPIRRSERVANRDAADTNRAASGDDTSSSSVQIRPDPFNEGLSELDWPIPDDPNADWSEDGWAQRDESVNLSGQGLTGRSVRRPADSDFTTSAITDSELVYSPQQDLVPTASLLQASRLPSFRSQQLDEKLALYRQTVEQSGPPDVLIIGSSRALRGVDPAALRQTLAAAGHGDMKVFNFGVNGATAQVVDLIVRRLIPANHLPRMVIWADGARAFNSGRTDVTFNAIAASDGYHQLEATDAVNGVDGIALGSLSDQLTVRATNADQQLSELFGRVSSAYTNRTKIRTAIGQGLGAITPEFADDESTRAGATPTGRPSETSLIDYDGFLALSTRFNPATYYQDHPRVAGAYDGDYKAFRMEGEQTDALSSILRFASEKDISIVFVNTPLTDEYLDSHRNRSEKAFQRYMLQAAERYSGLTYRDLGQLWPQGYDYFSDPSHLNRYGAYKVSERLAEDPLISWPDPLSEEAQ